MTQEVGRNHDVPYCLFAARWPLLPWLQAGAVPMDYARIAAWPVPAGARQCRALRARCGIPGRIRTGLRRPWKLGFRKVNRLYRQDCCMIELHITCLEIPLDRRILDYRPGYRQCPVWMLCIRKRCQPACWTIRACMVPADVAAHWAMSATGLQSGICFVRNQDALQCWDPLTGQL